MAAVNPIQLAMALLLLILESYSDVPYKIFLRVLAQVFLMKKINVLLFGAMPQPTGGVSIHVKRFLEHASESERYNIKCFDLRKKSLYSSAGAVGGFFAGLIFFFYSNVIHVHISNNLVKCIVSVLSKIFLKKVIYTHHNSLVSNSFIFDLIFFLSDQVILVNDKDIPKKFLCGKKYKVVPAFIPPFKTGKISADVLSKLEDYEYVVSTNCFSGAFLENRHLYGFDLILKAASYLYENKKLGSFLFVLVDPGKNVSAMIEGYLALHPEIKENILYLDHPIDFSALIKVSDVTIRATQTDGDSISVRESLYFNVPVIASDVSYRPKGTIIFKKNDFVDLSEKIVSAPQRNIDGLSSQQAYVDDVFEIYRTVLSS
jgi:glycosyltransferase involved in cell wall biosynthesis